MFEMQKEVRDGLLLMVSQNRNYIEETHNRVRKIHGEYIGNCSHLYSDNELLWINHFLDSVVYKSFLARLAIEQLQSIRHGRINEALWPAIENSLVKLDCSDNELVLVSFAFEAFLFEARSFLDIYMIFISLLLKTGFSNEQMNKQKFYNLLEKVQGPPLADKAKWIAGYFDSEVFGYEENQEASIIRKDWGTLLISLRDKISHRDRINFSFDSKEKFINEIQLDWPTIKGATSHSMAETIGNGIHALFHKGLCHIYEVDWDEYQRI